MKKPYLNTGNITFSLASEMVDPTIKTVILPKKKHGTGWNKLRDMWKSQVQLNPDNYMSNFTTSIKVSNTHPMAQHVTVKRRLARKFAPAHHPFISLLRESNSPVPWLEALAINLGKLTSHNGTGQDIYQLSLFKLIKSY